MVKNGIFLILILFSSLGFSQAPSALEQEPWLIYQVNKAHTLWKFAENLNVNPKDIPSFVEVILQDNPRLKNPNLIYPGEKILVRGSKLYGFVPKKKSFTTYWANGVDTERSPASKLLLNQKTSMDQNLFVQPSFGFERLTAKQRGTGASATLLSSAKFGLKSEYNWKNRWGVSGIGLGLDWVRFDENFGNAIADNSWLSVQLEWIQQIQLNQTWKMNFSLGYFQAPYLFTDSGNNLFLKLGGQPGLGFGIIKYLPSLSSQFGLKVQYLYFGYAGDTLIQDGIGGRFDYDFAFKLYEQNLQLGIWAKYDQLLSEVTEQNRFATGLGLGITW